MCHTRLVDTAMFYLSAIKTDIKRQKFIGGGGGRARSIAQQKLEFKYS